MVLLKGPQSFTINAPVGTTTLDVPKGEYWFEYKACGVAEKGKLPAKGPRTKLIIPACRLARVVLRNWQSGNAVLTLSGPQNYTFTVGPESEVAGTVLEGTYKWKLSGSCGSKSGTRVMKYSKRSRYWFLLACDRKPPLISTWTGR
jgi:hypothetical protein